jgi:hypothetical protein
MKPVFAAVAGDALDRRGSGQPRAGARSETRPEALWFGLVSQRENA